MEWIIYDEFLELKDGGKYLKNEVERFLELYSTVNRLRTGEDGRKEVRVVMIANKVSFVNPYFTYWGILPFTSRFKTFKDGLLVVENYDNALFKEKMKQTGFGKLVEGTAYGDYAIDNKSWVDDDAFIVKKIPPSAGFKCSIRYRDIHMGLYFNGIGVYIMRAYTEDRYMYAPQYECMDNEMPLVPSRYPLKLIKDAFNLGFLFFEDNVLKDAIYTIIQQGGKSGI